jgi:hypothetical protein
MLRGGGRFVKTLSIRRGDKSKGKGKGVALEVERYTQTGLSVPLAARARWLAFGRDEVEARLSLGKAVSSHRTP